MHTLLDLRGPIPSFRLTHVRGRKARLFLITESICRKFLWIHAPQGTGGPEQLLFACQPIAEMVKNDGDDFIFTCKESSHKALYDFMAGAEPERHQEKFRKGKATETRGYRWFEDVPLRDGEDAMHHVKLSGFRSTSFVGFAVRSSLPGLEAVDAPGGVGLGIRLGLTW
jgi:hypothetical protein